MDYRKILIVQTAFLGDVILITPLIRAVKEYFPKAAIDVMVIPQNRHILENNPHIRKLVLFNKRENKRKAFFDTLRQLKAEKYDLAISPHSSTTTALLLTMAGIKQRVGYDRWLASILLTKKIPHFDTGHKVFKLIHMMTAFTDREFPHQTELFPTLDMRDRAKDLVNGLREKYCKVIALAPGSVWATKRWGREHYTQAVKLLSKKGYGFVFLGGPDEKELCDRIIKETGWDFPNMAGKVSILESAAIIGECDMVLCNDSAPLHLGNAMKTPVFAFFGPTVKRFGYFPFRDEDFVFESDEPCRPCGSHGSRRCPRGHHNCMNRIEPQKVVDKVVAFLEDK